MDKYERGKVLGQGASGKALLCSRKHDQVLCVIKEIDISRMQQKQIAETSKEVEIMSSLKHPSIVHFFEARVAHFEVVCIQIPVRTVVSRRPDALHCHGVRRWK